MGDVKTECVVGILLVVSDGEVQDDEGATESPEIHMGFDQLGLHVVDGWGADVVAFDDACWTPTLPPNRTGVRPQVCAAPPLRTFSPPSGGSFSLHSSRSAEAPTPPRRRLSANVAFSSGSRSVTKAPRPPEFCSKLLRTADPPSPKDDLTVPASRPPRTGVCRAHW